MRAFSVIIIFILMSFGGIITLEAGNSLLLKPGEKHVMKLDCNVKSHEIELCVAAQKNGNYYGIGKTMWRVVWNGDNGMPVFGIEVRWGNEDFGGPFDRRFMQVNVDSIASDGRKFPVLERKIYKDVALYEGYNTLVVEQNYNKMRILIGSDTWVVIGNCDAPSSAKSVCLEGNCNLDVYYTAYSSQQNNTARISKCFSHDSLRKYFSEREVTYPEGLWEFLDRDTNAKWALPGGNYVLAIVKYNSWRDKEIGELLRDSGFDDKTPVFLIIYVSGARVNFSQWHTGMVKGVMFSTIFEKHYDLLWFDSYMEPMFGEQWVTFEQDVIMSLHFPLYHARIRYSKSMRILK